MDNINVREELSDSDVNHMDDINVEEVLSDSSNYTDNINVGEVMNDFNGSDSETVNEEIDNNNDQSDVNEHIIDEEEIEEISKLRSWAIECKIPLVHLDKLLKILQQRLLPTLPKSSTTFLKTSTLSYEISKMEDCDNITNGEYSYFGVEQGLQSCVNSEIHSGNLIELQINIDGMKLFKSSIKSMWPILIKNTFQARHL
nr:PREDICTED: uncharacterized protein LOC105679471 [Linepithema humile]